MVLDSILCLLLFLFFVSCLGGGRVDGEKGSRNSKRKRREEVVWRNVKSFSTDATYAFVMTIHL